MTIVFLVLLPFSFSIIAQFWRPLEKFVFLSPLHYHRPVKVLSSGAWPWKDMGVLMSAGTVMWLAGVLYSQERPVYV